MIETHTSRNLAKVNFQELIGANLIVCILMRGSLLPRRAVIKENLLAGAGCSWGDIAQIPNNGQGGRRNPEIPLS